MSIATVFGFLFETQGAGKVVSELKSLSFVEKETKKSSDKLSGSTKDLNNKTKDLAKSVVNLASSYFGLKKVLSEMLDFAKGGEDLALMAKSAGVGAEMLQRYGTALQNYGGGMSSAASTLSNINQMMQDIRFGQDSALKNAAIRYGLDISGTGEGGLATAEEMLVEIAEKMELLNEQEQLDFGRKLGLDPAMIALMQTGVQNLTEELKNASKFSVFSKEDLELSQKFQRSLREFRLSLDKIWGVLSRAFLPILTKIMNGAAKFFNYLSEKKGFLIGFFAVIAVALGVIAVKAAIAWAAILAPIIPIIAAIAAVGVAIGLLVDDFVAFMDGGESCIGYVRDLFADFFLWLFETVDKVTGIFGKMWDGIVEGFAGVFEWIFEKWEQIKSLIPFLGDDDEEVNLNKKTIIKGQAALDSTKTPLSTITSNNISNQISTQNGGNSNTTVKIDKVDVVTQASDAKGISEQIGGTLRQELEMTVKQNAGGVLA